MVVNGMECNLIRLIIYIIIISNRTESLPWMMKQTNLNGEENHAKKIIIVGPSLSGTTPYYICSYYTCICISSFLFKLIVVYISIYLYIYISIYSLGKCYQSNKLAARYNTVHVDVSKLLYTESLKGNS